MGQSIKVKIKMKTTRNTHLKILKNNFDMYYFELLSQCLCGESAIYYAHCSEGMRDWETAYIFKASELQKLLIPEPKNSKSLCMLFFFFYYTVLSPRKRVFSEVWNELTKEMSRKTRKSILIKWKESERNYLMSLWKSREQVFGVTWKGWKHCGASKQRYIFWQNKRKLPCFNSVLGGAMEWRQFWQREACSTGLWRAVMLWRPVEDRMVGGCWHTASQKGLLPPDIISLRRTTLLSEQKLHNNNEAWESNLYKSPVASTPSTHFFN